MRSGIVVAGTLLLAFLPVRAQLALDTAAQRGVPPGSIYSISNLDSVNLQSGNVALQIPLASLPPGPGGNAMQLGLAYNSQIYDFVGDIPRLVTSKTGGGWRYNIEYAVIEEQRPLSENTGQIDCSVTNGIDKSHQ